MVNIQHAELDRNEICSPHLEAKHAKDAILTRAEENVIRGHDLSSVKRHEQKVVSSFGGQTGAPLRKGSRKENV